MPELPLAGQLDAAISTMTAISVTMATHISATMARLGSIAGDEAVMNGTL